MSGIKKYARKHQLLFPQISPFMYLKLRPMLYHPVPGNVLEISKFPVVGHKTGS